MTLMECGCEIHPTGQMMDEHYIEYCDSHKAVYYRKMLGTTREELAALAHEQWSGWMKHLFSKCITNEYEGMIIPKWAVDRWIRQMNTNYNGLSEEEKDSDRFEADRVIKLLENK